MHAYPVPELATCHASTSDGRVHAVAPVLAETRLPAQARTILASRLRRCSSLSAARRRASSAAAATAAACRRSFSARAAATAFCRASTARDLHKDA